METANNMISVIVPTHNRQVALKRLLDSLLEQTYPSNKIEVVIVADGCTDETESMVKSHKIASRVLYLSQDNGGAAKARNYGAAMANGNYLLFLDDDIEASADLISAHMLVLARNDKMVSIGNLPPVLEDQKGLYRGLIREWWESMFYEMNRKGHWFHYRNLLSGNFALSKNFFQETKGFDTAFKCQEDYELGYRLIKNGGIFYFNYDALGYHHEKTDLKRSLNRKYEEGKSAISMGVKHPELIYTLPLSTYFNIRSYRILLFIMYTAPLLTDLLAKLLFSMVHILEAIRLRGKWKALLYKFLAYYYLKGIVDTSKSYATLKSFLRTGPGDINKNAPEVEIDLQDSIEKANEIIDTYRPQNIKVKFGSKLVGHIHQKSGHEAFGSRHLSAYLYHYFHVPLTNLMTAREESNRKLPLKSNLEVKE